MSTRVLAPVAGEPLHVEQPGLRVLELALLGYSVAVFATLAGTVGAFLLERRAEDRARLQAS